MAENNKNQIIPLDILEDSTSFQNYIKSKIAEFSDTFYIIDLARVARKYQQWKKNFPTIEIFYAVKCNNNPKILKFLANRYILVLIFFIIWVLFLDNYSYLDHRVLDNEIDEIEDNINYYKTEIKKDSASIKNLKNDDRVEKYAREKYYMKRDNEDIYIIEFEDDKKVEKEAEAEKTNSNK